MHISDNFGLSNQERLKTGSKDRSKRSTSKLERTGTPFVGAMVTPGSEKMRPASRLMSNTPPDLLRFMQTHLDSFTKWDLIHFFHRNPQTIDTAENIAQYIGRDRDKIQTELAELATQGILSENRLNDKFVYSLSGDPNVNDLLHRFVVHCNDRQFRVKAVYQIIQAMR